MTGSSPRRRNRGKRRGWIGYLLSLFLGALLGLAGYIYLTQEKPPRSEPFFEKIFLVDQIIQSQLYEIGIPRKDVLLHQSVPRKEGGLTWKEFNLTIQVARTLPFSLIENNLRQSLSHLGRTVAIHASQGTESLQLVVKVQDRSTHRLTFTTPQATAVKKDLRPKIALVIDDLGSETAIARELLQWNSSLTFSILPFTPHAKTIAREAHQKGKEVILHIPMEPHDYPTVNPGKGALLGEMDSESLRLQLAKDIEAVPHLKGVSNHMGSRLMEDTEKVRIVLSELKRRELFFLDSRTTPQTVGLKVAQGLGMRAMERSLFIDHSLEEEDIKQKIERLIRLSLSNGKAIGIGHPHPATVRSLKEMIPKIKERGIDLVPLSVLMD